MTTDKKTYYIGEHSRYNAHCLSCRLKKSNHIFMSSSEKFHGLPKDIEIINLGPVDKTRAIVRELRSMGFTDIKV